MPLGWDGGEPPRVWGQQEDGESLHLPLSCAVTLSCSRNNPLESQWGCWAPFHNCWLSARVPCGWLAPTDPWLCENSGLASATAPLLCELRAHWAGLALSLLLPGCPEFTLCWSRPGQSMGVFPQRESLMQLTAHLSPGFWGRSGPHQSHLRSECRSQSSLC